jgi:hypothetical protein
MSKDFEFMLHALFIGFACILLLTQMAHSSALNCLERADMVEQLASKHGEIHQSIGLTSSGQILETFAHLETGTWTILLSLPNGKSCFMASGSNYQSFQHHPDRDV